MKASNATPWFPASAGSRWRALPMRCASKPGDCFLLPSGRPFRLASDLALTPVDAGAIFRRRAERRHRLVSMAAAIAFGVGGHFALAGNHAGILLGVLPPIVHIRERSGQGGAALVGGADDAGAARAAAGRLSGRPAPRPHDAGPGAAAASGGRLRAASAGSSRWPTSR